MTGTRKDYSTARHKITAGLEARQEKQTQHMAVYGGRFKAEEKSLVVYPFGRFLWNTTLCQHIRTTHNFTASPYVVMATTHTASPACPWLPERTPETIIMRGRRMRENPS